MNTNKKMSKMFCFLLFQLGLFMPCLAWNIKKINSISRVTRELARIDENVLVVVDIDRTLLVNIEGGPVTLNSTFAPVEEQMVTVIKNLQERGVPVIALTSSASDYAVRRLRAVHLNQIGLDLSGSCAIQEFEFEHLRLASGDCPSLYHGILCTGGCSKGQLLESFILRCCPMMPRKVIFFDDQWAFCRDVCEKILQCGIPVQSYWYCAAGVPTLRDMRIKK